MTPSTMSPSGSGSSLAGRSRPAAAVIVVVALAACWAATYAAGGAGIIAPHWFYLPIILAANWFGPVGAVVAALGAGILAGPLLPSDVAAGRPQPLSDWGSRMAFFVLIGLFISLVIERRRRAVQELGRSAERLRALHTIDRGILQADSLEDLVRSALAHLRYLVPARRASLSLLEHPADAATVFVVHLNGETSLPAGTRIPLAGTEGILEVLRRSEPYVVEDLASAGDVPGALEVLRSEGARSYVALPLVFEGELLGILGLSGAVPGAFTPEHIEIAGEVADQLAIAVRQVQLRDVERRHATELEELVADLRRTDQQRRALLSRLVDAQEHERRLIADGIHDDTVQKLTAVGMRLASLRHKVGDDLRSKVAELEGTVSGSIARLRLLLFELRPDTLDRPAGLRQALRMKLQELEAQGISVVMEERVAPLTDASLSPEARTISYRIAQEALTNVAKHSQATRVEVLVASYDDGVLVRVSDDGVGFRVDDTTRSVPGHLGMVSMRERAELAGGRCRIESAEGQGTTVEFWIPGSPALTVGR